MKCRAKITPSFYESKQHSHQSEVSQKIERRKQELNLKGIQGKIKTAGLPDYKELFHQIWLTV